MNKCALLIIGLLWCLVSAAQEVVVETNPRNPIVGEVFQILFKCQTSGNSEPEIDFKPEGFVVLGKQVQGLSTRTVYQNGKLSVSRELLVSYDARADKKGIINLRDVKVTVDGKTIQEKVVSVQVMEAPPEPRMVFLAADVPKKSVYVGEGITVRYYLYKKTSLQGFDIKKYPKLDGFMKRFLQEDEAAQRVTVDGEMFGRSTIYSARLYPTRAGKLVIDPMDISATYANDLFGNMGFGFGLGMRDMKTKLIGSEPITIDVKPLPEAGRPDSFTGLVGKHDFELKINKEQLLVNEPLEVRLTVSGIGNLENLESLEIWSDQKLEKFDAKSDLTLVDADSAVKTFDYTFLAKSPGEIPDRSIEFSYFDPASNRYEVISKKLPALIIAGQENKPTVVDDKIKKDQNPNENDAEENKSPLFRFNNSFFQSPYLWWSVLIVISLGIIIVKKDLINLGGHKEDLIWKQDYAKLKNGTFGSAELLRLLSAAENELPDETKKYFKMILDQVSANEFKSVRSEQSKLIIDKKMLKELKKNLKV